MSSRHFEFAYLIFYRRQSHLTSPHTFLFPCRPVLGKQLVTSTRERAVNSDVYCMRYAAMHLVRRAMRAIETKQRQRVRGTPLSRTFQSLQSQFRQLLKSFHIPNEII